MAVFALGSCISHSISAVISSAASLELWAFLAAWGGGIRRQGKEGITEEGEWKDNKFDLLFSVLLPELSDTILL